ncbi:Transcriptional regulator of competence genes, TfoX/Sxy family [Arthrobacter sp. cf158]|uniref:TfoX/Sxy family protein n=1 Tax=Arthrobacter sp. cf158 TaxID=1761744 RepID=UPI000894DB54|nr:TfoX/Sxy family protein [Arthrobacter sp. cf158]SDW04443.1 Transcriptional regulator of competence genes, TfoX/Sxy family [Arthrobacter sp. cf158]
MQMPRPSQADKDRFRSAIPESPDVEIKPMFGNLGAFVNGNMFAGLFGPTIGVKLSEADRQELEANQQTQPFGPEETPMAGYVGLPESWQDDAEQTAEWLARALENVATWPPKAPKEPKTAP